MSKNNDWTMLSFLDVITCGLAAGLLLMLIAATNSPSPSGRSQSVSYLVVALANEGESLDEVGIRYRRKGEVAWKEGLEANSRHDSLMNRIDGPLVAWAWLLEEEKSMMEFQIFLRSESPFQGKLQGRRAMISLQLFSAVDSPSHLMKMEMGSVEFAGDTSESVFMQL